MWYISTLVKFVELVDINMLSLSSKESFIYAFQTYSISSEHLSVCSSTGYPLDRLYCVQSRILHGISIDPEITSKFGYRMCRKMENNFGSLCKFRKCSVQSQHLTNALNKPWHRQGSGLMWLHGLVTWSNDLWCWHSFR